MKQFRYILDPGSNKFICLDCGERTFVKYKDNETGNYLDGKYGRCDREINCGYHLNPYLDGYGKLNNSQSPTRQVQKPEPVFIPVEVLKQTLHGYEKNVFLQNLLSSVPFPFETKDIETVISLYFLGTVCKGYRVGAITFPYIDVNGQIRAIQVKHFNESNNTTSTDFLHSIIEKFHREKNESIPDWLTAYQKNERKVSCLFGEHLLIKYIANPVALVEAPKTAIYGTLYFGFPNSPDNMLWLAVYNLSSLNFEKIKALKGRDVFLFPDLSEDGRAYKLWSDKARELSSLMKDTRFKVSDLLENYATDQQRAKGMDLADYLLNSDWREFRDNKDTSSDLAPVPIISPEPKVKSPEVKGKESIFNQGQLLSKKRESQQTWSADNLDSIFGDDEFLDLFTSSPVGNTSERFDLPPSYSIEEKETETWNIEELESFFADIEIPAAPIELRPGETIIDPPKFIKSHLDIIKAQNGKPVYRPYRDRLIEFKTILENLNS